MAAFNIIQGGQSNIVVRLVNGNTGDPYDLTGCTALTTCFQNTDGSELNLGLGTGVTIVNATAGKIQVSISAAQSALLRTLNGGTLELAITFSADPIKVQIPDAYNVVETVC